jgi:soluble lytic murein transglycosylase-like protein
MMMFEQEIGNACIRYGLPVGLVHAIVKVESSGNPWAIRYEPGFQRAYLDGKPWRIYGAVTHDTEVVARATSWGLMQVMGQVARERGFEGIYLSELCNPAAGIEYGCRQLKHFEQRHFDAHGWNGVIAAYNAGSPRKDTHNVWVNLQYVHKVRAMWPESA